MTATASPLTQRILDDLWDKYLQPIVGETWLNDDQVDRIYHEMAIHAESYGIKAAIAWAKETAHEIHCRD
jgi:hypothetical protein